MPEGPEIHRAADRVARALVGHETTKVFFAFPELKKYERRLRGREVERVEARGKALLVHFDGGLAVYSHSLLYGRWYVTKGGELARTRRTLRLAVHNTERAALLYSASEIEVLREDEIEEHPYLAKLGPDPLDPDVGEADLARRLREDRFARRPLASLLLDQGFFAGIGNYLRSEILFSAGLHPSRRLGSLSRNERRRLARALGRVMRRAAETRGSTTDRRLAARLEREGLRRSLRRHYVFARAGRPCWRCDSEVERGELVGRRIYFCPTCQPFEDPAGDPE